MKILLVTFEFPPQIGGMENYYYNLIKHTKDVDYTVLTLPSKTASDFDKQQNFKIIRKKLLGNLIWPRWLKLYLLIKKTVKKEKIDLLWVGDVLPCGSAAYLLFYFYKLKYFVSTHGLDIMLPQRSLKKERLMKKILQNAEFVTANSKFTKKELVDLGLAEEKIELIYPCPNIYPYLDNISREKFNIIKSDLGLKNKNVVLTVSRLVARKGQDMVIRALPELLERIPNLVYLIIGDGPKKQSLKMEIADLKLQDKVVILDQVSNEELPIYYQLADLFVMTARNINGDAEGFGMVYLEAASFGLPSVAGKSGGVHEAVIDGQTGLLANPESVTDISQKIYQLLTDQKLYHNLSEQAKKRAENEFDWSNQAELLLNRIKTT